MLGKVAQHESFTCVGGTENALLNFDRNMIFKIVHNDLELPKGKILINANGQLIHPLLIVDGITIQAKMTNVVTEIFDLLEFKNLTSEPQRFEITVYPEDLRDPPDPDDPVEAIGFFNPIAQDNETLYYEDPVPAETELNEPFTLYKKVSFCLAPQQ